MATSDQFPNFSRENGRLHRFVASSEPVDDTQALSKAGGVEASNLTQKLRYGEDHLEADTSEGFLAAKLKIAPHEEVKDGTSLLPDC